jgi:plasmid stabilization system protein ParE
MKIKFTVSFQHRLLNQIEYIAQDSPSRARKFQQELILKINQIPDRPYSFRKSIYFDDKNIRELIFKGYTIVFRISDDFIEVFGFVKYQSTIEEK